MASLPSVPWRDDWQEASFKGCPFHVEVAARAGGRRVVLHEFPKREEPYAEDMGRMAKRFLVTGYFITYPGPPGEAEEASSTLRSRDYREARDDLISALEEEGEGVLVHPTMGSLVVVCQGFNVQDAIRERGGFCVVEMQFVEAGVSPNDSAQIDTQGVAGSAADALHGAAGQQLDADLSRAQ